MPELRTAALLKTAEAALLGEAGVDGVGAGAACGALAGSAASAGLAQMAVRRAHTRSMRAGTAVVWDVTWCVVKGEATGKRKDEKRDMGSPTDVAILLTSWLLLVLPIDPIAAG